MNRTKKNNNNNGMECKRIDEEIGIERKMETSGNWGRRRRGPWEASEWWEIGTGENR